MSLICRIELDQEKGLILTVEDKDGNITQTAKLDGKTITLTSKGESDTSVFEQKPDTISLKCKKFILEADEITCKSTKDSTLEAQGKFNIKSTDDMVLKSSANLKMDATSDVKIESANFSASAKSNAELSGMSTKIDGKQQTEISGTQAKVSAQTTLDLSGAMIKVAAQTVMNVEGLTTNLKGQITNVQGTLIKLG